MGFPTGCLDLLFIDHDKGAYLPDPQWILEAEEGKRRSTRIHVRLSAAVRRYAPGTPLGG